MNDRKEVFTIGHSTHQLDYFLELLQGQNINCVLDIRSIPYSKYSPQFNQDIFKTYLQKHRIKYIPFKEAFGARQENENVLNEKKQVDFELFRKTNSFIKGIERLNNGLFKGYRIVLMCAEGNPLDCHRFSMIAIYLHQTGFNVKHILKDKTLKSHEELEKQLLQQYKKKMPKPSLFQSGLNDKNKLKIAYRLHNRDIGWIANN